MRVTYDKSVNAAYIYLREIGKGECHRTLPLEDYIIMLDFDKDNRLIGIEVLNADKRLPPEVLKLAEVPKEPDDESV